MILMNALPTDQPTDTAYHRDARTHLKTLGHQITMITLALTSNKPLPLLPFKLISNAEPTTGERSESSIEFMNRHTNVHRYTQVCTSNGGCRREEKSRKLWSFFTKLLSLVTANFLIF